MRIAQKRGSSGKPSGAAFCSSLKMIDASTRSTAKCELSAEARLSLLAHAARLHRLTFQEAGLTTLCSDLLGFSTFFTFFTFFTFLASFPRLIASSLHLRSTPPLPLLARARPLHYSAPFYLPDSLCESPHAAPGTWPVSG